MAGNMTRNYQKELDEITAHLRESGKRKLLLHSCCAPCSSYCLEYLSEFFDITVFYFNPNITDKNEFDKRAAEQERLINTVNNDWREKVFESIKFVRGEYDPPRFLEISKGLEKAPEGGERCRKCFELRLGESARYAKENGFDYFTTTLTISPLKNAHVLNEVGSIMGERYGIAFLPSDFKKKNGYKRSTQLSKQYDLYRQDYCGCAFSKAERMAQIKEKDNNK